MSRGKIFILILLGLALLILVFLSFNKSKDLKAKPEGGRASTTTSTGSRVTAIATSIDHFSGALNTLPDSLGAPKQEFLADGNIPAGAIKLEVSDSGFTPKEFTVFAGQPVSLALKATGSNSHAFLFPDASLMALTMMIYGGDTKMINFIAPEATGTYPFRDDIPQFRQNTGAMIVR
jgi:hypothetical protein